MTVKIILVFLLVMASLKAAFAENSRLYNLEVIVNNLRSSAGVVQFALYNQEESIPDEFFEKVSMLQKVSVLENTAKTIFVQLPAGRYAVNILHDENNNGVIDKGLILPVEGIGFTNYDSINIFNRPNFDDASFLLGDDMRVQVKIIYM